MVAGGLALATSPLLTACAKPAFDFEISLAQWSLHNALFAKKIDNLDFARIAKEELGISALEYVNQFFFDKAKDKPYLDEMNKRAADLGVKNLLIMIDREGDLGDSNDTKRKLAVENHYKWIEAAKHLGCHSIRVNAGGDGTEEEVAKRAIDSLSTLSTFGKDYNINVIVENHGGYSSNGKWLSNVIKSVDMGNCGTLPDFGNFCIKNKEQGGCEEEYDRYKGVKELMPYAKGVSAKSQNFDNNGNCTDTDFLKMLKIVKNAGFSGYIGVEYGKVKLSEMDGIKATKELLEKTKAQL
ncbi:MAG: TIM barrel protein [Cyclobacteriaceae bacterium]